MSNGSNGAIERYFVHGTRLLTITGFDGQGKTYLALEAGRWLQRTGMFQRVCLVSFADFQGVDAVGAAVSTLATVLEQNLIDKAAATTALSFLTLSARHYNASCSCGAPPPLVMPPRTPAAAPVGPEIGFIC